MTLSRCKHCGAVAHYAKSVTDPHLCWSIQCSDCGIATPSYSQQEMAAAAWNRTSYTHRNGETEAPCLRGDYFFRGTCLRWWSESNKRRADVADIVYVDEFGQPDPFSESHSGEWSGQWWGPVQAPWERPQ